MKRGSKAQAGVEYLIIIGFVTLAISIIIGMAYFYTGSIKDRIKLNQVESFANQIINSAESVFFSGEPSEATINLYLPEGVKTIEINTNYIIITTETSSGENKRAFASKVQLTGTISSGEGIRKIHIKAESDRVSIS